MNENNNGIVGSFIAGAVLGAGLALLLTPVDGRETRRRLKGQLQGIRDMAGNGLDKAKHMAGDGLDKAKHMVGDKARHLGDGVKEGVDAFRRASEEATSGSSRS